MVIGAIVGAVVFVGPIISGYGFDNIEDIPKYVIYNGAIGAILGFLHFITAPILGWPLPTDNVFTCCIAFAILAEIPLFNILMGLSYGGLIGHSIEILLKSADWSWI